MESTVLSQAMQRSVNQQMAVWLTQVSLLDAIVKALANYPESKKETLLQTVLSDIAADKEFFKNEINGRFANSRGVHQTIVSNKMAIEFDKATTLLSEEDGSLLYQILSGKISRAEFDVPEPTGFAEIGVNYYGSARSTILTTILFCIYFTSTGRTIADISNQCGILQKTNLPIDFGIIPGIRNRWVMRGNSSAVPDIVGIPHSGFAFGGHRRFPYIGSFDLTIFDQFISPFSPEDGSSFVFSNFTPKMLEPYPFQVPLTTFDMQNGYRRHLLKLPDTEFPFKHKIDAGTPSDTDPAPLFLKQCFTATFKPQKGDLVLINRYADITSPEEDVIYSKAQKSGHCGIFYQGDQFFSATREIDWDWEGIGLQSYLQVNKETNLRRKVSFLRVNKEFNPKEDSTPAPQFADCVQLFNQRFSLKSPAIGNLFSMVDGRKGESGVKRAVAANQVKQIAHQYITPTKNFVWGIGDASVMVWTDPTSLRASIVPTREALARRGRAFDNPELRSSFGISAELSGSFDVSSQSASTNSTAFTADPNACEDVWKAWEPPTLIETPTNDYRLDHFSAYIGSGATAHVVKGRTETGLTVAIKVAPCRDRYPDERSSFDREVAALKELKHPHIVRFYGKALIDQFSYIILEYMEQSLRTVLDEYKTIKVKHLPNFLRPLLSALEYLHTHPLKLVHKDIKPENVLLTSEGVVKLIDFNVATSVANQSDVCHGTLRYMPPEVKHSLITPKFDIWSLGIMLIELATGQLPSYYQRTLEGQNLCCLIDAVTTENILDGVDLGDDLAAVSFVKQCLQPNPDQRADAHTLLKHDFLRLVSAVD